MRVRGVVALAALLLWPVTLLADGLVLIQGHLGHGDPWRQSGVATALVASGWQDGGHLFHGPRGVVLQGPMRQGEKQFYTISLDSSAPLLVQQHQLDHHLEYLASRHAGEPLHLVGHSTGGVVARLWMVQRPTNTVRTLITIASPHLGTGLAELGQALGASPMGWLSPWFGAAEFNRSQALFSDLGREQPGTLLYWLNRQPHPEAHYVALLREGDSLIPPSRQDMNHVVALRGRVHTLRLPGGHALRAADGHLLAELLASATDL